MTKAATDLPTTMIASDRRSTCSGSSIRTAGSKTMPTLTKNSTAKASRSGSASRPARWLSSDSLSTMPARNAPSASETPNASAEPNEMPRAIARMLSVNSSREPARTTSCSSRGTIFVPTSSMNATNSAAWPSASATSTGAGTIAQQGRDALAAAFAREHGQQHEDDDREDVLDDQPANRDVTGVRLEQVAVLQRAQQHDGAGHRQAEAEDQALGERPAPEQRHGGAQSVATAL